MQQITTAKEMAAMDAYTIDELAIPGIVLMENAGIGITAIALDMLEQQHDKRVHIFCGSGNNGGDGYVVARHLRNHGVQVQVFVLSEQKKIKGDAKTNASALGHMGQHIEYVSNIDQVKVGKPDLFIDAMLGTGVTGSLRGLYAQAAEYINEQHIPVLAVDIPTGVNADTGRVDGPAIQADATATMATLKRGLLLSPGREHAGHVSVIDISMPPQVQLEKDTGVYRTEQHDVKAWLPKRTPDSHKNKMGTVAVVAGSEGLTGAAAMSSEAALRAGAGLCYLITPRKICSVLESLCPEIITHATGDANTAWLHIDQFDTILEHIQQQDILALGPGLGQHPDTVTLVHQLLSTLDKPLVLDADGLNACQDNTDLIRNYKGAMILTPHPGELARLTGYTPKEITANNIDIARDIATSWGNVLILKGGPAVVAWPDGKTFVNPTGNAGMATAGSGDVLTGVLAGLLAQGMSATAAAVTGVYIHGAAGDVAAGELGQHGMLATDLLKRLPNAIKQLVED